MSLLFMILLSCVFFIAVPRIYIILLLSHIQYISLHFAALVSDSLAFSSSMPTPCARCKPSATLCKVDLRSGKCCECIRRGYRCDLFLTQKEWSRLKQEKARFEEELNTKQEAKAAAVARNLWLRKELATLSGERLEAAERELAAAAIDEDDEIKVGAADISLRPSPSTSPTCMHMSVQEWTLSERLPNEYWGPPGLHILVDEETVFGEIDSA